MSEQVSLRDEIRKLNDNFESMAKKKEVKKFNLPFSARNGNAAVKKGYASICYIGENREIQFMKVPMKEGTMIINGKPYVATTDHILTYKRKPFLIVPSWSIRPFSPSEDYEQKVDTGTVNHAYSLLLNLLENDKIKSKGFGNFGMILLILVGIGVGLYYFMNKGGV